MKIRLRGFVIEDIEGEPPCARLLGELSNELRIVVARVFERRQQSLIR